MGAYMSRASVLGYVGAYTVLHLQGVCGGCERRTHSPWQVLCKFNPMEHVLKQRVLRVRVREPSRC